MDLNCKKCNKVIRKVSEKEEAIYKALSAGEGVFIMCDDCSGFKKKKSSTLSKIFEVEEVIEVKKTLRRKYKVNWKRLFLNFVSVLMFWKRDNTKVQVEVQRNPESLIQKDVDNKFVFTKALAEWTVKNTPVREGFGDGDIESKRKVIDEQLNK